MKPEMDAGTAAEQMRERIRNWDRLKGEKEQLEKLIAKLEEYEREKSAMQLTRPGWSGAFDIPRRMQQPVFESLKEIARQQIEQVEIERNAIEREVFFVLS